ncbi:7-carboxy-7-deazaguanine synthase QueE [Kutzneria viridogrisea]|uniref:7-carboxy-7-deazaguanine synthase n=1 Tax=Kutzneria viridogrisea TaxID=47990 RepID=A0ABR6BGC0_9PSEU|nr:organic radical activating enzyme [Kutzneria viridogrisea]
MSDGATLPVAEVFGPTVQGEGPAAGTLATFIRLSGCNLSCGWCDTPYTWDATRYDLRATTRHVTPRDLAEQALAVTPGGIVVVTGGEPLLQQDRPPWAELLRELAAARPVHIETNGTLVPNSVTLAAASCIVVSPKLPNAGGHRGHQDPAMPPAWREIITDTVHLKVVCHGADDVRQAVTLAESLGCPPARVWVMPEGRDQTTLASRWPVIADAAARHGINATHRLHVLAWGDARGH